MSTRKPSGKRAREPRTKTTPDHRCCICGWRFDYETKPCSVCLKPICTGCTHPDDLARHYDRDADHFRRAALALFWSGDNETARIAEAGGVSAEQSLERMIERRMEQVLTLRDPKRSVRRLLQVAHGGNRVPPHSNFAVAFDLMIGARVLALASRGDLREMLPPLMRGPNGEIIPFEPAADMPPGLPPMIAWTLRKRVIEEEEEEFS